MYFKSEFFMKFNFVVEYLLECFGLNKVDISLKLIGNGYINIIMLLKVDD